VEASGDLLVFAEIFLGVGFLGLEGGQILVQAVETFFPKAPVVLDPVGGFPEWGSPETTNVLLRVDSPCDQSAAFENLEVFRNRWQAHREGLGKFGDDGIAPRKAGEDRTPGWIGESGKRVIESISHLG
jgi:hypothetical protein